MRLGLAFDQAERAKKAALAEKMEQADRVAELQTMYNNISSAKRKAEGDYSALQEELEEMENAKIAAEEKAQRAHAEASRLAADVVSAQEGYGAAEKSRDNMAKTVAELTARAEEAESSGGAGLKAAYRKLEVRVMELEQDFDAEAKKAGSQSDGTGAGL